MRLWRLADDLHGVGRHATPLDRPLQHARRARRGTARDRRRASRGRGGPDAHEIGAADPAPAQGGPELCYRSPGDRDRELLTGFGAAKHVSDVVRHVRERTLLVEGALSDGQLKALKNRGQPRTVELLAPLREDLVAWRVTASGPPATAPVFPS